MSDSVASPVVVGVFPGQPDPVVLAAASIATRFGSELVCAYVDRSRYTVDESGDGTVRTMAIDPDLPDLREDDFPPKLRVHLAELLDRRQVTWSTRALAGDPAFSLGRLAETIQAAMIVIGTRDSGLRDSIREFFDGSVAVRLAHRQHRPVVVVPLSPVPFEQGLPWEVR